MATWPHITSAQMLVEAPATLMRPAPPPPLTVVARRQRQHRGPHVALVPLHLRGAPGAPVPQRGPAAHDPHLHAKVEAELRDHESEADRLGLIRRGCFGGGRRKGRAGGARRRRLGRGEGGRARGHPLYRLHSRLHLGHRRHAEPAGHGGAARACSARNWGAGEGCMSSGEADDASASSLGCRSAVNE